MSRPALVRYLSHPQVVIDPNVPITEWALSDVGTARIDALSAVAKQALAGTTSVFTSPERKARDAAAPLARALGCPVQIAEDSYENDRSATGYLPPETFETTADSFFAQPKISIHGWEKAENAQERIVQSVTKITKIAPTGDILIVGHGAVGTLLYCAFSGQPISREFDQGPGGGGNYFSFYRQSLKPLSMWLKIETLIPENAATV